MVIQGEYRKFYTIERYVPFKDRATAERTESASKGTPEYIKEQRIRQEQLNKSRCVRETTNYIESQGQESIILLHFYTIYKSDYCKEHIHTLMYDWDIEEVIQLENQIAMFTDLEEAAERDQKRESKKEEAKTNMLPPNF